MHTDHTNNRRTARSHDNALQPCAPSFSYDLVVPSKMHCFCAGGRPGYLCGRLRCCETNSVSLDMLATFNEDGVRDVFASMSCLRPGGSCVYTPKSLT